MSSREHDEEEDQLGGIRGVDAQASRGVRRGGAGSGGNGVSGITSGLSGFRIVTDAPTDTPSSPLPPSNMTPNDEVRRSSLTMASIPTYNCDKCTANLAQNYCDACGLNFCDDCDALVHESTDSKTGEDMTQHYREPMEARASYILESLIPRPTAEQIYQASMSQRSGVQGSIGGAPSVSGMFDLQTAAVEESETLSERAYEAAQHMIEIKKKFRDPCDERHPNEDTAPPATIYCDTCGLNYCDACDAKIHPEDIKNNHSRHPITYEEELPKLPRRLSGIDPDAINAALQSQNKDTGANNKQAAGGSSSRVGGGLQSPTIPARNKLGSSLTVGSVTSTTSNSGTSGSGSRNTANLPKHVQEELAR